MSLVERVDLLGWESLRLADQRLSLVVTPQIGGRVMSLVFDGEELFFQHPELRGRVIDVAASGDPRARKRELGFLLFGGEKTWLAPQERWTDALPFVDLDAGRYAARARAGAIEVESPVCRETGAQLVRRVSLEGSTSVRVEHELRNRGDAPMEWGLWGVAQLAGAGTAVLPIGERSSFPGGVKAYPAEGRSPEIIDRFVRREDGLAFVRCAQRETFKYGTDSRAGWIVGLLERGPGRSLAFARSFAAPASGRYAHEADVEVYDSDRLAYFELEVHAPLERLAPGEAHQLVERWSLGWLAGGADAAAVREFVGAARAAA